jgi:hypothetical protein
VVRPASDKSPHFLQESIMSVSILRSIIIPIAVVLMGCATAAAQKQSADLIVTNAKVHTMDGEHPQATAFAVKDGKFIAVGNESLVAPYRGEKTRLIDARGRTRYTNVQIFRGSCTASTAARQA